MNILGGYMYMAITNNKRPIRKPEDFKGLKFRVMDPMGGEMFKAFGASAVPIAWAETYTSLQTGVADGQTNPPFIIAWAKFNEVQKYMTLANSQWGYQMSLANKQWHDSLSPEDRRALYSATQAANATANGVGLLLERASIDALKKGGMEVIALTDQEIVEMQKVAGPHCLAWAKKAPWRRMGGRVTKSHRRSGKEAWVLGIITIPGRPRSYTGGAGLRVDGGLSPPPAPARPAGTTDDQTAIQVNT